MYITRIIAAAKSLYWKEL